MLVHHLLGFFESKIVNIFIKNKVLNTTVPHNTSFTHTLKEVFFLEPLLTCLVLFHVQYSLPETKQSVKQRDASYALGFRTSFDNPMQITW